MSQSPIANRPQTKWGWAALFRRQTARQFGDPFRGWHPICELRRPGLRSRHIAIASAERAAPLCFWCFSLRKVRINHGILECPSATARQHRSSCWGGKGPEWCQENQEMNLQQGQYMILILCAHDDAYGIFGNRMNGVLLCTSEIFHLVHWWEFLCRVCNRRQSASKACGESCAAGKVLDKSSLVQKQNYMHEKVTEQTGNFTTTCLFVHTIYSHTLHNHVPIPKIMGWLRVDKINDDTPLSLYNIRCIYIYI